MRAASWPFAWYVLSLGTPNAIARASVALQLSGELRGVVWLCYMAMRGQVLTLSRAEAWLTVKASAPAAMGPGVRPSATRRAPAVALTAGGCCTTCASEPRQTWSPAVTVQSGRRLQCVSDVTSVAQCTVGPALRRAVVGTMLSEALLRHEAGV